MKFGLKENIINMIKNIIEQYPQVHSVILYGSRAKGNYRNSSDIDITLKGHNIDLKTLNKITDEIDDLLLPYKFDISIMSDIENQDLLDHIKRVGVNFY